MNRSFINEAGHVGPNLVRHRFGSLFHRVIGGLGAEGSYLSSQAIGEKGSHYSSVFFFEKTSIYKGQ